MRHITFALHVGGGGGGWRWELKARRPPSQWPQLDTFNIFCVRPLDIFQDTSGQFPASFTATKKNGIFNRSQDISRRVCTNQNTRWAKTSPKYVKFNRHALKGVSFFIVFHFSSLFGVSKTRWAIFPVCTEMTSWYHNTEIKWCFFTTASWSLKKVRNRTNTSKSKALRTYFVSEPRSVSVGERQQRQCSTL